MVSRAADEFPARGRCPRCGGLLFKDQLGEVWCLCGWRAPGPLPAETKPPRPYRRRPERIAR